MDASIRRKILDLLDAHRIMTLATVRPDGWPQATTVGYVNEGMVLYFLCGLDSQKARNLARDDRVSLTIDHDTPDILAITGLSMAARATAVHDRGEAERILRLLPSRYPTPSQPLPFPMPTADQVRLFRLDPVVISVLDYRLGFGHSDLVECAAAGASPTAMTCTATVRSARPRNTPDPLGCPGPDAQGAAMPGTTPPPVRIGCAGWSIPARHAHLFGEGDSHLARYATRFDVVEINSTFHRPHQPKTFERWAASVPPAFRFSVKLPRTITHDARLADRFFAMLRRRSATRVACEPRHASWFTAPAA